MSTFLIAIFLFLVAGATVTFILARKQPELTIPAALVLLVAEAIAWFIIRGQLPQELSLGASSTSNIPMGWSFRIDELAWQLSLYLFLLTIAVCVAGLAWVRNPTQEGDSKITITKAIPAVLLMTAIALLALWLNTLFSIVQGWSLLALSWMGYSFVIAPDKESHRESLLRAAFLLSGVLFLGLAAVNVGDISQVALDSSAWPERAMTWAMLASATMMGVFILHWWRPLKNRLPPTVDTLAHLVPVFAGGSLMIRLLSGSDVASGLKVVLTLLGLLGLLAGVIISWMRSLPRRRAPAVAMSAISLTVLTGIWVGQESSMAELRVSTLAVAVIFIISRWKGAIQIWQRLLSLVAIAALAGLPLTAGFDGLLPLYAQWLEDGQFLLVLILALLMVPLLAVAFYISWPPESTGGDEIPGALATGLIAAALVILTAGLISIDSIELIGGNIPSVAIILISTAGGFALSRYPQRAADIQRSVRDSIAISLPLLKITEGTVKAAKAAERLLRTSAANLEGELGMLWILILSMLLWLARGGR